MVRIEFKLHVISITNLREHNTQVPHVDGVTKLGRPYRAEILLEKPHQNVGETEISDVIETVRELMPILIKAGYHAREVNRMKFAITLA